MTRDAEHTPTGYEDAASVVVNQAPAPSSLAGGEEAEFATALARVLDRHGLRDAGWADADIDEALSVVREPSAVSRATVDAILPMISERLAALSPEAPAREGVEALRTALIKARSELAIQYCYSAGRMGIAGCYPELAEKYGGSAIVQEIDAVLALTPRHEAPASEDVCEAAK